jgi:hypothetical protein
MGQQGERFGVEGIALQSEVGTNHKTVGESVSW